MRTPLFSRTKRWAIIILAIFLSSILLAACDQSTPSILNTAGPVARQEANLFWFILIVATIVFVGVESWLIFSIIRYRDRPNAPAPRQIHGNNVVEITWTAVPSVILFIVLGVTIYYLFNLYPTVTNNTVQVQVIAHQWWWEFDYIGYQPAIKTADDLHIPAGVPVQVDLESNNVIHSFWVPALTGKLDVIPGHHNKLVFEADANAVGQEFRGECTEFCGAQHAHMDFYVIVDSPDGFNSWITAQQQAALNQVNPSAACKPPIPQADLISCGAKFFATGPCVGCHGIVGVNLKSYNDPKGNNLIGPNLTHFGSRDVIAGGVLTNTPQNLAEWLNNPQAVKPGNDMPQLGLSQDQINALVAYLESLK